MLIYSEYAKFAGRVLIILKASVILIRGVIFFIKPY
jgi:hypothetical protein